jgi:hypothetical protein
VKAFRAARKAAEAQQTENVVRQPVSLPACCGKA